MEQKKKPSGHGGARPGAGRPKGSTNSVSVAGLLEAIDHASGRSYIELLAEDFANARQTDKHLAQKYHHLIMSKVAATLTAVEVSTSEEQVEAKQAAFLEALQDISGRSNGTSPTNGPH